MAWTALITLAPSKQWTFTPNSNAIFFRIKQIDSPYAPVLWMCQAELSDGGYQIFDVKRLPEEYLDQVLRFDSPGVFTSRVLGIRTDVDSSRWQVQIEASDYQVSSSNGSTTNAPAANAVSYTASQSSAYNNTSNLTASYNNLTDTNGTTGGATNAAINQFIKADFGQPVLVKAVSVGGGNLSGWGSVANYLNSREVQYSTDNINWVTAFVITGVADSGATQFPKFVLPNSITARYWQIKNSNGYVATTEFRFE